MNEAILKGKLTDKIRKRFPEYVVDRLEDRFTHGVPDIGVTGNKITTWIEVKYADPGFASKGIQELSMLRRAKAGFAFYVVFYDHRGVKRTYIVPPSEIGKGTDEWDSFVEGFDYDFVAQVVSITHNPPRRT